MATLDIMNTELAGNDGRQWYKIEYSQGGEVKNEMFALCPNGDVVDADGYPMNTSSSEESAFNAFMSSHIESQEEAA